MAKRLIDADDAIKRLRVECVAKFPNSFISGLFAAADALDKIPAVDAVAVVRCRDCKHYDNPVCEFHSEYSDQYTTGHTAYMESDDFCSYGERRKDE